jgi:regulator of replication initiation timing
MLSQEQRTRIFSEIGEIKSRIGQISSEIGRLRNKIDSLKSDKAENRGLHRMFSREYRKQSRGN